MSMYSTYGYAMGKSVVSYASETSDEIEGANFGFQV